ncbi:hypothetical protein PGT21_028064 [Puccinia graminis f. sp. tritici]|uniref:Uncharacterized protein n=1 Tax=Puccinia graminis f. sp. tritici TaxID=56615 RepID=A0A5B0PKG3_PUCGR|nr:hypothetical protein PGT21_028064 [Puccinia graminis f. sp. tritici]
MTGLEASNTSTIWALTPILSDNHQSRRRRFKSPHDFQRLPPILASRLLDETLPVFCSQLFQIRPHRLARSTSQFRHCRSNTEYASLFGTHSRISLPMSRCFLAFVRSFRLIGKLRYALRIVLPTLGFLLSIKAGPLLPPSSFLITDSFLPHLKTMTSPHSPRSYYSISSDYSPTQTFDEDGDSFTSFGSIETPPRLRAMIRSIFDGTLNSPIRSFPDSDYGDTGSSVGSISELVGLCLGETFGDRRNRLLGALPPSIPASASAAHSSVPDEEYELDDSVLAPTPRTDQDPPTIDVGSPNLTSPGYVPNAHIEVGKGVGLPNPNHDKVSHVDPCLQLPSEDDDQSDIDPYEDPTDTTYVPPKKILKNPAQPRSSGSYAMKPKATLLRPRDAKGRFVSFRSKKGGKARVDTVDEPPTESSSFSFNSPPSAAIYSRAAETAANTFLNTVLVSPEECFPFTFHLPDPFAAPFSIAGPSVSGINPFIPPTPFINIRPDNPRLQFRTAFVDLLRVIVPFLSNFTLAPGDYESFKLLSHAVVAAQDWGDNPPKTIHDLYQHQWVLPPMLPPLLLTVY